MEDPSSDIRASCIFCKIIRGEVPSQKAHHEDDKVVSFPDVHPRRPGHTLVVPAQHVRWFWELSDDLAADVFKVARKIAGDLKEEYKTDYVRLAIVGTDVPHVHLHLVPQMFGDKVPLVL